MSDMVIDGMVFSLPFVHGNDISPLFFDAIGISVLAGNAR